MPESLTIAHVTLTVSDLDRVSHGTSESSTPNWSWTKNPVHSGALSGSSEVEPSSDYTSFPIRLTLFPSMSVELA